MLYVYVCMYRKINPQRQSCLQANEIAERMKGYNISLCRMSCAVVGVISILTIGQLIL